MMVGNRVERTSSSANPRSWPHVWAIYSVVWVSQILLRIWLFHLQFQGINLFGGDSGVYYRLAKGLEQPGYVWPMGWPWLLQLFLSISDNPYFLLVLQTALALGAQYLFIITLIRYGGIALPWAAWFSVPLFYNPFWIRLNSLVVMADTAVVFWVALSGFFAVKYLVGKEGQTGVGPIALSMLLGCMTFFKLVLRVWSVPLVLCLAGKTLRQGRLLLGMAVVLGFMIGPVLYVKGVALPYLGTFDYDTFSGYSIFANLLPHTTCQDLASSLPQPHQWTRIAKFCDAPTMTHPAYYQLWRPDGFLRQAEEELVPSRNPLETNRLFKRWAWNMLVSHPWLALRAMKYNLVRYLSSYPPNTLSFEQKPSLGRCEFPIMVFFGLTMQEYQDGWRNFVQAHARPIQMLDRAGALGSWGLRWVGVMWGVALVVLMVRWQWFREALLMGILALIYAVAVLLGGYYEPRAYVVLDYMLWLSLGLGLKNLGAMCGYVRPNASPRCTVVHSMW